jgi:predicted Zn-dependent peptidase
VSAVTPQDVQEVAKKYLDPEHMVLVVAGAVDQKGNPLAKPDGM